LLSHEGNFDVVASETKARNCITAAKDHHAQVIVIDSNGLDRNDLEFLMGARTYGDFGVALVSGDHEVDCKFEGRGILLKAQFLKKV